MSLGSSPWTRSMGSPEHVHSSRRARELVASTNRHVAPLSSQLSRSANVMVWEGLASWLILDQAVTSADGEGFRFAQSAI